MKNYPGAKSGSGIVQFLINNTPHHNAYYELYGGSAQFFLAKRPAAHNLLNDVDLTVAAHLQRIMNERTDTIAYSLPAVEILTSPAFWSHPPRNCFVYLDPPYPFSSRRAGKVYYRHEMNDEQHRELLNVIVAHPANIMISTRQNAMYDDALAGWQKKTFTTADRAGPVEEVIYMNYPPPSILHQYDYVGNGFADRQRIKRKVLRFHGKVNGLPSYERHLLMQEMIKADPTAAQHFLTMLDKTKTT